MSGPAFNAPWRAQLMPTGSIIVFDAENTPVAKLAVVPPAARATRRAKAFVITASPLLFAALADLHRVCVGMDLEDQQQRPTEEEYQAAMRAAAAALARAEGGAS